MTIPVVDADPTKPTALPTADSFEFFTAWGKKSSWKNEVTVKRSVTGSMVSNYCLTIASIEALRAYNPSDHMRHISPSPLLMVVMDHDTLTPTDLALKAYAQAIEPKELLLLPGGHFDGYTGRLFAQNAGKQTEFLSKTLCSKQE